MMSMDSNHSMGGRNKYASGGMPGQRECWLYAWLGMAMIAGCGIMFFFRPDMDITVSNLAFDDGRFPWADDTATEYARFTILWLIGLFYLGVFFFGLWAYSKHRPVLGLIWHKFLFIASVGVLGPLFAVNVILKGFWGRARPSTVTQFGGDLEFTHFWEISGQCESNCSFVSGEVATVTAIFFSLALVLGRKYRLVYLLVGALVCALSIWLRIGVGAHFLSDTIVGAALMLVITSALYAAFYLRPHDDFDRAET